MIITIDCDEDEAALLKEALDSHIYWQLSDEQYRNDGFVSDPGSDDQESAAEITACELLSNKIEAAARGTRARGR